MLISVTYGSLSEIVMTMLTNYDDDGVVSFFLLYCGVSMAKHIRAQKHLMRNTAEYANGSIAALLNKAHDLIP